MEDINEQLIYGTAQFPEETTDYNFKIIIIGDPCCGKTSLLLRTTLAKRNETYEMTVGVDCKSRTFNVKNKKVRLQIWDTAGQERFTNITTSYYRGTHCCILVFDITNQASFFNLFKWIDQYNFYNELPLKNIIIVGNKHDLEDQRQISRLEISKFCESMECDYIEISVLENQGIEDLMTRVVEKCMEVQIIMEEEDSKEGKSSPSKADKGIVKLGGKKDGVKDIKPLDIKRRSKKSDCCA